jgi:hypothetical protein
VPDPDFDATGRFEPVADDIVDRWAAADAV